MRSFKETPKSKRAEKKSPNAATVEITAILLFTSLFGNRGKLDSVEEVATSPGLSITEVGSAGSFSWTKSIYGIEEN